LEEEQRKVGPGDYGHGHRGGRRKRAGSCC
jgi:hypothetical protein